MTDRTIDTDTQAEALDDVTNVAVTAPVSRRKKKPVRKEPHWPWLVFGMLCGTLVGFLFFVSVQSYGGWIPDWVRDRVRQDLGAGRGSTNTGDPSGGGSAGGATGAGSNNALGPADAAVTVVEYSDFQCPFCRRAFSGAAKQIIDTYVSSGKVRFVYKHLAFLGQESIDAAVAAECAADQGKFWDYHDYLFNLQVNGENVGAFTKDKLTQYAQAVGLDMARFTPCLQNNETLARVEADGAEARDHGFGGTPSFLVHDTKIVGAQPSQAFSQVIDAALNK